ncbi:MAG: MFS transporter, partial [Pseudomonadota bacterium]
MKAPPSGDKHTPYSIAGVVAAIAAIMIAATGLGHSLPLFSILLKNYGVSDSLIGLNTAMYALGFTALAPFFPRIIIALGLKPFNVICVTLMVVSYGAIYLAGDTIWLWYPIRAVYGFAVAGIFVGSEIWVNKLAPPHIRGQIIGIYTTFVALGLALGPLLVDLYGYNGLLPFAIGMGIFALAALPICFVK